MTKKPYQKPELKEVKLVMEDTLLTACRSAERNTTNSRVTRGCSRCRVTYRVS
ncbi:MAG: hypothetical protein V1840_00940 [Candidatus Omnitrophota bacterium]